jgi:hypothetical protein
VLGVDISELKEVHSVCIYKISLSSGWVTLRKADPKSGKSLQKAIVGGPVRLQVWSGSLVGMERRE